MSLTLVKDLIDQIDEDMQKLNRFSYSHDPDDLAVHIIDVGQLACLTATRVLELEERIAALENKG